MLTQKAITFLLCSNLKYTNGSHLKYTNNFEEWLRGMCNCSGKSFIYFYWKTSLIIMPAPPYSRSSAAAVQRVVCCPCFDWVGFFILELHVFKKKIKPLFVTSNIFSQSISCLLVLFMVSFAIQKLVHWLGGHLFIFAFISTVLGDWSKKTLACSMSENVLPVFSSRAFMISCLTFQSI